jgi:hypothetical protein
MYINVPKVPDFITRIVDALDKKATRAPDTKRPMRVAFTSAGTIVVTPTGRWWSESILRHDARRWDGVRAYQHAPKGQTPFFQVMISDRVGYLESTLRALVAVDILAADDVTAFSKWLGDIRNEREKTEKIDSALRTLQEEGYTVTKPQNEAEKTKAPKKGTAQRQRKATRRSRRSAA